MAQPVWHATASVGYNGKRMKVHQLLPKANEGSEIKCFREEVTEILSGVHVHCLDKLRVTESLHPFLSGIHMAEPTSAGVCCLRCERLCGSIVNLKHKCPRELNPGFTAHVREGENIHGGRSHCINLSSC